MSKPISNRKFPPPAAMMDERRTLLTFGWIVGSIVVGCFALSAISLTVDTHASAALLAGVPVVH
jgi:hypothetical protein